MLTAGHVRHADAVAAKFCKRHGVPLREWADLRQAARLGLCRAFDRYDPTRGVPFTAFAFPAVVGAMKDYVGASTRTARPVFEEARPPVDVGAGLDLLRALAALPDRDRRLFLAVHLHGHRANRVAAELGIRKSWVSKLLERTRRRLRESLDAE